MAETPLDLLPPELLKRLEEAAAANASSAAVEMVQRLEASLKKRGRPPKNPFDARRDLILDALVALAIQGHPHLSVARTIELLREKNPFKDERSLRRRYDRLKKDLGGSQTIWPKETPRMQLREIIELGVVTTTICDELKKRADVDALPQRWRESSASLVWLQFWDAVSNDPEPSVMFYGPKEFQAAPGDTAIVRMQKFARAYVFGMGREEAEVGKK
jgi:hypothetical protein